MSEVWTTSLSDETETGGAEMSLQLGDFIEQVVEEWIDTYSLQEVIKCLEAVLEELKGRR